MKTRIIGIVLAVVLAVAGLIVLLAYVRGADDRALADVRMTTVYVIKKAVPAGTAADSLGTYLATERIPAIGAVPARVTDLSQITGMVSTSRLEVGEQLIKARWAVAAKATSGDEGLAIPTGYEALTVALPPERELGARIQTGDRVGVIATFGGNGQKDGLARQILQKVLVLSVQNPAASKTAPASGPNSAVLITLAVQRSQAELVAWDQQMGDIYLALQPPAALEGGRTVTLKVLFP